MVADEEALVSVMNSIREFINEMKEDNDRAVVIIGVSNLETLLKKLVKKSLLQPFDKKNDELLGHNSPLSTFSSNINLCYRLGVIDKESRQLLHMLRDMRNHFAHNIKNCDLNSPPHSDRVNELAKHLKDSPVLIKLRELFISSDAKSKSRDFKIMLALISSLLEMKLHSMPTTMKANPVSIHWIPKTIEV